MSASPLFFNTVYNSVQWLNYVMLFIMFMAAGLAQLFVVLRERHEEGVYSPALAWLRAGIYACCVLLLAWLSGVLAAVVAAPLVTGEQLHSLLWWGWLGAVMLVLVWAYGYWWPRGTLNHGRRLHLVPAVAFGLVWGCCSGLVLLSMYALLEGFGFGRWVTLFGVVFLFSCYSQLYQAGWWDIQVSPPHNIRAWNARKVLFGHLPFLLTGLAWFAQFGNAGLYVLLNGLALACCAIVMRFPPWWLPDGGRVSRQTALGV